MTETPFTDLEDLQRFVEACRVFEEALRQGQRPSIDRELENWPEHQRAYLRDELLKLAKLPPPKIGDLESSGHGVTVQHDPAPSTQDDLPWPPTRSPRYRGQIDVRIKREVGPGTEVFVRLDDPRALPMGKKDRFRIAAQVEPAAYVYIVWVDPGTTSRPSIRGTPRLGGDRDLAGKSLSGDLLLPPSLNKGYTAEDAKPGVATMVHLARPTPLDVKDDVVLDWFKKLPDLPPLPPGGERAAVWFDDYLPVTNDASRTRTFRLEEDVDPFAVWQDQLRRAVGDQAAFQSAVSFARR